VAASGCRARAVVAVARGGRVAAAVAVVRHQLRWPRVVVAVARGGRVAAVAAVRHQLRRGRVVVGVAPGGRVAAVAGGQPRAGPVAGGQLHAGLAVAAGHLPPAAVVQVAAVRPACRRARRARRGRQGRRDPAWRRPRQTPRARP
jgi:pimeloyl-ACP methyl ester carboxylesterase